MLLKFRIHAEEQVNLATIEDLCFSTFGDAYDRLEFHVNWNALPDIVSGSWDLESFQKACIEPRIFSNFGKDVWKIILELFCFSRNTIFKFW